MMERRRGQSAGKVSSLSVPFLLVLKGSQKENHNFGDPPKQQTPISNPVVLLGNTAAAAAAAAAEALFAIDIEMDFFVI